MKNKKWHITSFVFLTLLIFLISSCSGGNTNNNNNPEKEDNPPAQINSYTVKFYIDGEVFESVSVEENKKVILEKEIPTKEDKVFDGWYKDDTFTEKFDLETPITSEISLYGRYNDSIYFDNYNSEYLPSYSPVEIDNSIHEGDENIDIALKISNTSFNNSITPKMINLDGSLKNLKITALNITDNNLIIKTEGKVSSGKGSIVLAKEATKIGMFIYKDVDVSDGRIYVDQNSLSLNLKDHHYFFTVKLNDKEFDNSENLTPAEYIAKYNNKDDSDNNYFTVNNSAYSFSIKKIHDDWKGFDVQVYSQGTIDKTRAQELKESVVFSINGKAFKDKEGFDFKLDIDKTIAHVNINVQPTELCEYEGKYNVKLVGARFTEAFKNNKDNIVNSDKINKLFLTMANDTTITIKSMKIVNDSEISGDLEIHSQNILVNEISLLLDKITLDDNTSIDCIRTAYSDDKVSIEKYFTQLSYDYNTATSGTFQQTASSNYSGIVNVVEDYTFVDNTTGFEDLISLATEVGKIGVGLAIGSTDMAQYAAGNILGIDAIRNPTVVILEAIKGIMDKLNVIEEKIDRISEKLDTLQDELRNINKETLLSNFLDAFNAWNAFVTDYYDPLVNAINNYSSAYFSYYYNLVVKSVDDENNEKPTITLYFDSNGKLAYLDDESSNLSIDGRMIDKSKTLIIEIPKLIHALTGISKNEGHAYSEIEDDIIFDISSSNKYDEETIKNIVKTLRFNAMKNYFSSQDKIDSFTNIFSSFCTALTGSSITTSGVLNSFTPLDCYNLTLETVYNFGFEAEADLNLVKIKLEGTYYCAKQIILFVDTISHSQSMAQRIEDFDDRVKNELKSDRFYHRNDENGNIYSYATDSYLKYSLDALGMVVDWEWKNDTHTQGKDTWKVGRTNAGNFNKDVSNYEGSSFKSITQADAELMAIKVKVYNKVKGTNYTFKEYLAKIGMISENQMNLTYGLALSVKGVVHFEDDEDDNLSYYKEKLSDSDINSKFALKGSAMSLDNSVIFNGLTALYFHENEDYNPSSGMGYRDIDIIRCIGSVNNASYNPFPCHAYYVTFEPVN